jgi:hypothetical protein
MVLNSDQDSMQKRTGVQEISVLELGQLCQLSSWSSLRSLGPVVMPLSGRRQREQHI